MNIRLYDECAKRVNFDNPKYLSSGECGSVFKLANNKCLKYITDNYAYDVHAFQDIIELDLINFCQVYQLLFNENGLFSGYIMKYYDEAIKDILTTETEYTIESLKQLIISIAKITNKGILIRDLNNNNVILSSDLITVIDFDMYKHVHLDHNTLAKYNYDFIMYLFKCLYLDNLKNNYQYTTEESQKISALFNNRNTFDEISKKLIKYKYPIDYIKWNN